MGQDVAFLVVLTALVWPIGGYLERVFSRRPTALDTVCGPIERVIYRATRVDPTREMAAGEYSAAVVLFAAAGTLLLYVILRVRRWLPWFLSAYQTTPLTPDLSFNTAISFATTTTWQAYAGETTMSYASQMIGLCVQNFLAGPQGWRWPLPSFAGSPDERPRRWAISGRI